MKLANEEGKLNFIVSTQYSLAGPQKGASVVLHKLAYEIAKRGHNSYVFNEPYFPHENIKVIPTKYFGENHGYSWETFNYPTNKTISIYYQLMMGNPYNTQHNVRWILHDYSQQSWETFGDEDMICNFGDFKIPENTKQIKLTLFDYKLDKFKNLNDGKRNGFCYLIQDNKSTPPWGRDWLKNFTSVDVSDWKNLGGYDYLLKVFNENEYLITFEDKTYLTTIAALCGAKSIVVKNEKYSTPIDFKLNNPTQLFGVAYGLEDIGWANKTINLVRDNIIELEKKDSILVDNFIKYWEKKIL
jgi:hypothetical protein